MFERNSNTKSPNNKFDFLVELEETIKICRDFYAGYNNIVNLDYLFKLHLETDKAYQLRKNLTPFSNYYASIINNVSSIVTKKEPISENLQNIKEFNTFDVDNKNNTLTNYIKKTCEESLVAGAEFVAVFKRNEKIFLKNYKYENLYSFQTDPSTGELTRLTFKDYIRVADGLFAYKTLKRYISFTIKGGEIYSYNKNSNGWELVDSWESTLNYIPIVPIITGISKNYLEITPKMYDIALLNKTLLNLESQLANVLSFIGNPIPMVFGDVIGNEDGEGMSIGTREGLEFENKKEHGLEYAEIEGASVEKLQEQIGKVITSITSLALNMNSAYNSSHTTIDAEHNTVKNLSYLTDIAEELENKFNKIVNIICDLSGTEFNEDVQLKFKKDFESKHFDIKYAEILNTMVSEGNLSLKTWYNILKSNNILPKELNIDGEVKTVEELKKKLNIKEKENGRNT